MIDMIDTTNSMMIAATLLFIAPALVSAACPFMAAKQEAVAQTQDVSAYERLNFDRVTDFATRRLVESNEAYYSALDALDFTALEADLVTLMHTSQDEWPSDWQAGYPYDVGGHYGPFFIR
jgi:catalase (peroxidase I)